MKNSTIKKDFIIDFDSIKQWSYSLASEWAQKNLVPKGITSSRLFDKYKNEGGYLPKYFPRGPLEYFNRRNTWGGWNNFFGDLSLLEKNHYVNFHTAKLITQRAQIANSNAFKNWKERPASIPAQPRLHYKEWVSWEDFLGRNYDKGLSKLKENEVLIIKHQLQLGVPACTLARMFGVSDMQVIRIKRGENWKHISL